MDFDGAGISFLKFFKEGSVILEGRNIFFGKIP